MENISLRLFANRDKFYDKIRQQTFVFDLKVFVAVWALVQEKNTVYKGFHAFTLIYRASIDYGVYGT